MIVSTKCYFWCFVINIRLKFQLLSQKSAISKHQIANSTSFYPIHPQLFQLALSKMEDHSGNPDYFISCITVYKHLIFMSENTSLPHTAEWKDSLVWCWCIRVRGICCAAVYNETQQCDFTARVSPLTLRVHTCIPTCMLIYMKAQAVP